MPAPVGYVYVRERAALGKLIERVGSVERVALDTEADSLHNYFEKVCLIQLSMAEEHYVIDPLAGLDLTGLVAALSGRPLVVHGGDYDLRMMRASMGFRPGCEVFDTMIAAQLLGMEQVGLAALVERFFAVSIAKEGQKSDWSRRPLSEKQLRYAVNDTRFLEPLADRLREKLRERGRVDWHRQSCRAMTESTGSGSSRDPEEAWRIKGAGRLSRRQLAYLREIWRWRDQHARDANMPPFKILRNEQLFEVLLWAESRPGMPLRDGPKLPRNIDGSRLSTLEAALAKAAGLPRAQWPEPIRHVREQGLSNECRERVVALRGECAQTAKELQISASTLAPRAALEAVVRSGARSVDEIVRNSGLLRWQAELLQDAVEKVCICSDEHQA